MSGGREDCAGSDSYLVAFFVFGLGLRSDLNTKVLSWHLPLEHLQAVWLWQEIGVPFSPADLGMFIALTV